MTYTRSLCGMSKFWMKKADREFFLYRRWFVYIYILSCLKRLIVSLRFRDCEKIDIFNLRRRTVARDIWILLWWEIDTWRRKKLTFGRRGFPFPSSEPVVCWILRYAVKNYSNLSQLRDNWLRKQIIVELKIPDWNSYSNSKRILML